MKLNGASKPRQGASKQGSSPGVVLNKYRIKRYYKVNENVVNGLPLIACGLNKKYCITENISNSNNICINNQQQQTQAAPLTQQKQKGICEEKFSNNSLSRSDYSASTKNKNSTTPNIIQASVSAVKKTIACCSYVTKRVNKNNILQTKLAIAAEAVADVATAKKLENNNKGEKTFEIDLKERAAINITTRQIKKTTLSKECKNNKNNINDTICGEKKRKQVKIVKTTTLDFLNNHVTFNRSRNTNNNNISANKRVNKFPLILKIYESLYLAAIISRLLIQLDLLLFFMFSHATKHLTRNPFATCGGGGGSRSTARIHGRTSPICCRSFGLVGNNLPKIMRASQPLKGSFGRICFKNASKIRLPSSIALCMVFYAAAAILLPQPVVGDDGDSFFPTNGLETTTPEFDYASRGQKKFGDKCDNTLECGFPGSICDPKKKSCQCTEDLPVTNHIDKCGKEAAVNETCFFNEQCEVKYFQTECRDQRCVCRFDMTPIWLKDGSVECKGRGDKKGPETYIDPAMIGVLIGMALMFIIICVVLRLFSQARWRENRTIFNTPNPRLMNVSLLRESKLLHGQERRGSRMSVRAPSRQPSMASLRPHSPNPSLGKTGSGSNSHGSNASVTSLRSTRSNSVSPAGIVGNNSHHERKGSTYQPHQHQHPTHQKLHPSTQHQHEQQPLTQTHIISNPVAETVTVEIIEPEK